MVHFIFLQRFVSDPFCLNSKLVRLIAVCLMLNWLYVCIRCALAWYDLLDGVPAN